MFGQVEDIIAPITGPGPAAVTILRLSGERSWAIAGRLFAQLPVSPQERHVYYGRFSTGDDGYLTLFSAHRSFTGEDCAEFSIHGSRASVSSLVQEALRLGARLAKPGEFTQRAFMNGRIDLTEAEAIRDTVEAQTDAQLRLANANREGALRRRFEAVTKELFKNLALLEAHTDFSEELGELDDQAFLAGLSEAKFQLDALLETSELGRIIRNGLRIAIVGPPNAGKSSLLNAVLGIDRAIVTDMPGTTRDYIEESVDLAGFPAVLIDTAGLRDTEDMVEAIGVQKARAVAANADVVWLLQEPPHTFPYGWGFDRPTIRVASKLDLAPAPPGFIGVSAHTRRGLDNLISKTISEFIPEHIEFAIAPRHKPEIVSALEAVENAIQTVQHGRPADLTSVSLRLAIEAIGRVTGETADADMVSRIFADFCIGK
jgi:tRNA modification GTPase